MFAVGVEVVGSKFGVGALVRGKMSLEVAVAHVIINLKYGLRLFAKINMLPPSTNKSSFQDTLGLPRRHFLQTPLPDERHISLCVQAYLALKVVFHHYNSKGEMIGRRRNGKETLNLKMRTWQKRMGRFVSSSHELGDIYWRLDFSRKRRS